jgi:hypothetical protein
VLTDALACPRVGEIDTHLAGTDSEEARERKRTAAIRDRPGSV